MRLTKAEQEALAADLIAWEAENGPAPTGMAWSGEGLDESAGRVKFLRYVLVNAPGFPVWPGPQ